MEGMSPEEALNIYIDLKKIPRDRARLLQEYGERLIKETMSED